MQNIAIDALSIKILISCDKKPLSKRDITQNFKRHSCECRRVSIEELLCHKLIEQKEMLKPGVRRVPTYYFISAKGKEWLKNYLSVLN